MTPINCDGPSPFPGPGMRPRKVLRGPGLVAILALHLLTVTNGPSEAQDCTDVDLVLAIDGSGSIDVAVVLWGDTEIAVQILPWARLQDTASAEDFALDIERMNRRVQGNTGLGRALWQSLDLLAQPGQCGLRKIVNVFGDGHETVSPHPRGHVPLTEARKRAEAMHVIVNALAIETKAADLAEWYHEQLIVGAGAFVMWVEGFDSFAEAIAKKLIREVAPANLALTPDRGASGRT